MKRFNGLIKGKVQGVFYRATALERAKSLDLKGFIHNLPDGNVELEVQGKRTQLQEFLEWCQQGPTHSRVDTVLITWQEPKTPVEADFCIV